MLALPLEELEGQGGGGDVGVDPGGWHPVADHGFEITTDVGWIVAQPAPEQGGIVGGPDAAA